MPKADFFFYGFTLLMLSCFPVIEMLGEDWQNYIALGTILLLGIPHGAIDNSIFLSGSGMSVPRFFAIYIGVIGCNVLLWFILPDLAYAAFILLSAYHFGQSQLTDVSIPRGRKAVFMLWGLAVMSTYLYSNRIELLSLIGRYEDLASFGMFFNGYFLISVLIASVSASLGLLIYLTATGEMKLERFVRELFVFGIVAATAYLFSFLLGFALFFVTVHAFKVLQSEYGYLRENRKLKDVKQFIKALLPLSLLSIAGIAMLTAAVHFELFSISYPLLFMVIISSITVPHAYVMERFYKNV